MTASKRSINQKKLAPYIFIAPAVIFFCLLLVYPILFGFLLSFQDWNLLAREASFVGLGNYAKALRDPLFRKSLWNTVYYTLMTIPPTVILSLILALMINSRLIRYKSLFRVLYFVPVVTSMVAISFVWKWMYNPRYGLINLALEAVGFTGQSWLSSPTLALPSVAIMMIWQSVGFYMVLFIAGLQGIPETLYEAATIDGANRWQTFSYITLPLLNPTIVFILITSVINSFQVFVPVFVMTSSTTGEPGGPLNSTRVLVYHLYSIAFRNLDMGYGSAIAFILFAILLIVTVLQFKVVQQKVEY
ncbi:MAG: sugar ABC transporter permease [Firmicutes bacterium]|nr:sugar ABC transporter permease [Bacillota bacterium]